MLSKFSKIFFDATYRVVQRTILPIFNIVGNLEKMDGLIP